jgi:hypothetical protein
VFSPSPSDVITPGEQPPLGPATTNEVVLGPAFQGGRTFDFGSISVGATSEQVAITLKAHGAVGVGEPTTVTEITIVGDDPADFRIDETDCLPDVQLAPQDTCQVGLSFTPTSAGSRVAVLQIGHNAGLPVQVRLTGIGVGQ